jgi:hypothetical protein
MMIHNHINGELFLVVIVVHQLIMMVNMSIIGIMILNLIKLDKSQEDKVHGIHLHQRMELIHMDQIHHILHKQIIGKNIM